MVKDLRKILDLAGKTSSCSKCKFVDRKFVPAHSYNDFGEGQVVIVGEAPGYEEAKAGIPFIGDSGKLLRDCLKEVGFKVEDLVFTNVCKCHPDHNETPEDDEILLCTEQFLRKELELLKPSLVIAVGAVACKGLGLKDKISEVRGQILPLGGGITVIPTFHPAYILRNYGFISTFKSDLRKAYNLLYASSLFTEDTAALVTDLKGLEAFETFYKKCKDGKSIVAIDIETNNVLEPFETGSSLVCVGASDGDKHFCVFLNHPDVVDLKYHNAALDLIKRFMKDRDIGKVGHNLVFDVKWLVSRGIEVDNILGDTMVMCHILDENRNEKDYGLKVLTMEYFGCYKHHMDYENLRELGLYNCEDVYYTKKLYEIFWNKMDAGQRVLSSTGIAQAIPVLAQMELEGIQIDLEYCKELSSTLELEKQQHIKSLDLMGFKGVNLNSNDQIGNIIFDQFGEAPLKVTKGGKRSVDEETIAYFAYEKDKPWAKTILDYRKNEKLLTTYIDKFYDLAHVDSRVRGHFHMTGTITGRLSSSKPNLQNIPRDGKVLRMFTATKGYKLFYFDFSQIELRIAASIANERTMIKMYVDDKDIHRFTGARITGKAEADVTKDDRQKAKAVNFGFLYGASADTFQRVAKMDYGVTVPIAQCEKFRKTFFETFSDLQAWYDRVRAEVKKTGNVRYPTGRIRHLAVGGSFEDKTGDLFRQAVNSPVQGGASDVVVFTMGELFRIIRKRKTPARFLLTVHDSVMLECWNREDVFEELKGYLDLIMADVLPNKFKWLKTPMKVDVAIGDNWSKLK